MSAVLSYVISLVAIEAFPEGKTVTNTDDQASDNYHKIVCYFAKGNPLEDFPLRFQGYHLWSCDPLSQHTQHLY